MALSPIARYRAWSLFRELCNVHHMSRADVLAMRRIQAMHQLEQPSLLFVDPMLFDVSPDAHDTLVTPTVITDLRDRIFGQIVKATKAQAQQPDSRPAAKPFAGGIAAPQT